MNIPIRKIINIFLLLLFVICAVLIIKWSSVPFITEALDCRIFSKPENIDEVLLGIVTGYSTGYVIYVLTVLLPDYIQRSPMKKQCVIELHEIYSKSVGTLLLMYKSVLTEKEWEKIDAMDDLDALDSAFYEKIRKFDMYADAYTLYHFKDGKAMMWCDYWEKLADYFQNDSVQIFLRYHAYLDDNMIKVVVNIKNNVFLGMMTGNTIGVNQIIKGKDGYKYFDAVSVSDYFNSTDRATPIFMNEYNLKQLKEYDALLREMRKIIYSMNKKEKQRPAFYLERLKDKKTGKCASAITTVVDAEK